MNNEKINCLFVVPTLRRAGAETQLVDLVNRINPNLFSKNVLVLEDKLDQSERIDKNSVNVICIPKTSSLDLKQIKKIAELIDELSIDVIHSTLQYSAFLSYLAIRRADRKPSLIAAIHTTKNIGIKEEIFDQFLYRFILNRCSRVIFVCEYQRKYWIRRFPELNTNSCVVYNGVDIKKFTPDQSHMKDWGISLIEDIPSGARIVSSVAGLRKEKGHDILLKSFTRLPPNTYLLLGGEGEMKEKIESLAWDLGISNRIRFLGNLEDVRPLLSISDVMVLASTSETFPMAVLEALAMGVPVVASDVGGMKELIEHGRNGHLVSVGDIEGFHESIEYFLSLGEPEKAQVRDRCRRSIVERYTLENMVRNTEECLQYVFQKKRETKEN